MDNIPPNPSDTNPPPPPQTGVNNIPPVNSQASPTSPLQSFQTPPQNPQVTSSALPVVSVVNPGTKGPQKKYAAIAVGFLMFILLVGGGVFFFIKSYFLKSPDGLGPGISKPAVSNTGTKVSDAVSSAYSTDTDQDTIPDSVENELGFNPVLSEFTRCAVKPCGTSDKSDTDSQKNNILIIVDSSGSMNTKIGGKTKMELAKESIKSFMTGLSSNVSVGIMVYGHEGSNSESSKAVSCASAEVIAPIGTVNNTSVDTYLSGMSPVGWTPIGLAIKNGVGAFSGKEGQKNQMIIVTDGVETCGTNPVGEASNAKSGIYKIQVDVIGFAINSSEQSSLSAISTSGGGLFSLANNSDELVSKMRASHENFNKFVGDAACITNVYTEATNCLNNTRSKVSTHLNSVLTTKKGDDYKFISDISQKIFKEFSTKLDAVNNEWTKTIQERKSTLVD